MTTQKETTLEDDVKDYLSRVRGLSGHTGMLARDRVHEGEDLLRRLFEDRLGRTVDGKRIPGPRTIRKQRSKDLRSDIRRIVNMSKRYL